MTLRSKNALLTQVIKHSSDKELERIIERLQCELQQRRAIAVDDEALKRAEQRLPRNWHDY